MCCWRACSISGVSACSTGVGSNVCCRLAPAPRASTPDEVVAAAEGTRAEVIELNMSVDEALTYVISMGSVAPSSTVGISSK